MRQPARPTSLASPASPFQPDVPESPHTSFAERTMFLKKFLTQGTKIASLSPSSRWLSAEVARFVSPRRPQVIVELGAGTGPVTAAAAARMHPESRLIAVERDPDLAELLRKRVPRAEVVVADAADLDGVQCDRADLILSGLPVPSLPADVTDAFFGWVERVGPEAPFSQITELAWVYQRFYRKLFTRVRFRFVARNVPPSGVYHCRRLRPDWREAFAAKRARQHA